TRMAVLDALGRIGGEDAFAVVIIADVDNDPLLRHARAAAITKIYPNPCKCIRAVVALRAHQDREISKAAREVLQTLGPGKREAVPELVELLENCNLDQRRVTCETLGSFGSDAAAAVPKLLKMLDSRDSFYDVVGALG